MDTGRKKHGKYSLTYMLPTKITYNIWQTGMGWAAWVFPAYLKEWVSRDMWVGGGLEMDMEMLVCCSVPFFFFHYVHTAAQPATTFPLTSSNTLDKIRERDVQKGLEGFFLYVGKQIDTDTHIHTHTRKNSP